ncbi:TfoX/Sxy family DNA transformation protein [Aquimixticola soesokkakensis]|nr:TfoX/Sxy family DNA transformation protein [Aquimixticola soesokkakensis]
MSDQNSGARPVTSIRNLGPAMAAGFARAGIETAQEIEEMGADAAYAAFIAAGGTVHFIAFYSLVLGLQGRPWRDASPEERPALRKRFEALKAGRPAMQADGVDPVNYAIEADLDLIGTGLRR